MPRAIISSGHTSQEPGSKAHDLVEYEVARKIAKAVVPLLRQHGVITLIVPTDLDLIKRIDWINKTNYDETNNDIAIEVHINEGEQSGIESWYEGGGDSKSKQLSELILKNTSQESGLPSQGAKSEYEHEIGSIAFLHDVNSITTLIECGYIDNENDAKFLKEDSNIDKLAKGVAKGVLEYFGIVYREDTISSPIQNSANSGSSLTTGNLNPPQSVSINPDPVAPQPKPINQVQSQTSFNPHPQTASSQSSGFNQPYSPGNNNFNNQQKSGGFMTRDDRKKLIQDMYVKILGREPNQNDLNYFLNIGISEQELIKKMIDSQEHADLVKSRQEVIKAKEELNSTKTELIQLRTSAEDQKVIIRNLHTLIAQKNQAIAQFQHQAESLQAQKNQVTQSETSTQIQTSPQYKYKGTFIDKLFKAFSDVFE